VGKVDEGKKEGYRKVDDEVSINGGERKSETYRRGGRWVRTNGEKGRGWERRKHSR
jgi:hypothetical protein